MPELPEVEVIRRGLLPHISGRTIRAVECSGKKLRNEYDCSALRSSLVNTSVTTVERRAKYLLFRLSSGDILIIHLGMTGKLGFFAGGSDRAIHDHLFLLLDNNMELRFNDTRRFGSVQLLDENAAENLESIFFANTGPEPFSSKCSAKYLMRRASGSTQAVKTFIMNSSIIAGVGNIYANESLFTAKIHPATPAGSLSYHQWRKLISRIREILNWAIDCGGSTISDFLNSAGQRGYFQANFRVYGKDGQPCRTCSRLLEKCVINGRASYFCRRCQRRKSSPGRR